MTRNKLRAEICIIKTKETMQESIKQRFGIWESQQDKQTNIQANKKMRKKMFNLTDHIGKVEHNNRHWTNPENHKGTL